MAELTPKQFVDSLRAKAVALRKENKPLQIAAQTVHALRVNRIFHLGLNSDNAPIGTYATSPEVWIENDYHRRGGNNGGKTGRAEKTSYYQSYAAFKRTQGFGSNVVLRQTNRLQSDFANKKISVNADGVPQSKPIKVNVNRYIERITSENEGKLLGAEKRYGNIFDFTTEEMQKFNEVYNDEAIRILEA